MIVRPRLASSLLLLGGLALFGLAVTGGRPASAEPGSNPPVERGLSGPDSGAVPGRLVVRYKANASPGAIKKLEKGVGATASKKSIRSGLTVLDLAESADLSAALQSLLASSIVSEAGPDRLMTVFETPDDPSYSRQWHLHAGAGGIAVEGAWTLAPSRGAGIVVAVIDTGVAFETYSRPGPLGTSQFAPAPDLAGVPIVAPWSFLTSDAHANDDHGHGTHVAGTILQATNNALGMAGVAPGASLMPLKVLNYAGQGQASDLLDAIYYAVDNGADVINMSLGFTGTGAPDASGEVCSEIIGLAAALQYADARGVTVVAASGNDSGATVSCPAAYPTVIAVGATRLDGQVAFYSNQGAAIDVTAPGGDPNVDQDGDGYADGVLQQTFCLDPFFLLLTGNYTQFCDVYYEGTSMATPHVAGIAALLLGYDPGLSPAQVRHYLESTARDRGPTGWDAAYGAGIVDATAALALLTGSPPPVFTPTPTPSVSPTPLPTATPTATPTPVPDAPTNLAATTAGPDAIALSWTDNSSDEQFFRVERSSDGVTFAQVSILAANTTTWTNASLAPDTTYHFRIRASTGTAYSAYSNVASATTGSPPAAPTNLVAATAGPDSIALSWTDNSSDEQFFRVERSSDGVTFAQVGILGANTTSWTNTGLAPDTTYSFRVRASTGTAYSGYSNVAGATTGSPPAAPSGLAATAAGPDSIALSWTDNSPDEQYFRVERSNDGVTFAQVGVLQAGTTSWTNAGLATATTYHYRVRASAGTAYSGYSNTASATTASAPAAPSGLVAAALGPDSIHLTWSDNSSDEQYFRVERSSDGVVFSQVALLIAGTTSYTNGGLAPSTSYHYRVRASAGTAYSAYSNIAVGTTSPPPAAPSNLVAIGQGPDAITLTWTDNATDEQYYRVERSSDGVAFAQVATVIANTTTWTNSGLAPSTTYYFRLRAVAGSVNSDYSNVAWATTSGPPAAPTNLVATSQGTSAIKLTWTDNANDEQYYRIERSTDGATFSLITSVLANTTSWTNSGLAGGTTYYYRVRASAGTAYSAYSNTASATTADGPAAPSDLVATALSSTSVKLTWTDNSSNEQFFRVERSTDRVNFAQVAIRLSNTTTWTNNSLVPGVTYYYRVRASAGTAYSDYSNVAVVTPGGP